MGDLSRIQERLAEEEFLRNQLTVTERDYSEAVASLLKLAMGDTCGSRAAAQVLLSSYNGHNYHMDLTDLCVLDLGYLQKALIVIRGRSLLMQEPHSVIENGSARFGALEEYCAWLHVKNRYKESNG